MHTHTHAHTMTVAETAWVLILVRMEILLEDTVAAVFATAKEVNNR